jgi:hypothetical protein
MSLKLTLILSCLSFILPVDPFTWLVKSIRFIFHPCFYILVFWDVMHQWIRCSLMFERNHCENLFCTPQLHCPLYATYTNLLSWRKSYCLETNYFPLYFIKDSEGLYRSRGWYHVMFLVFLFYELFLRIVMKFILSCTWNWDCVELTQSRMKFIWPCNSVITQYQVPLKSSSFGDEVRGLTKGQTLLPHYCLNFMYFKQIMH